MISPGVNLAVGVSGSGKTGGMRDEVFAYTRSHPAIVLDPMREWRSAPPGCKPIGVQSITGPAGAIARANEGFRLIVVETDDVARDAEQACEWARRRGDCGVAMPEAHRIAPNGDRLPPSLDSCLTAWRHYRNTLWLDTQRLALLHKTATEQASEVRIHAVYGQRDLAVIREWGGRELEAAVSKCAAKLAEGRPGWCVRLGIVRRPPYVIENAFTGERE